MIHAMVMLLPVPLQPHVQSNLTINLTFTVSLRVQILHIPKKNIKALVYHFKFKFMVSFICKADQLQVRHVTVSINVSTT